MENAKPETRPQLGEARGKPTPAIGRFPYAHRTCRQVREDQERAEILRGLGR